MSWGSDTNDESKPNWTWLTSPGRDGADPKSANVFATGRGWVHRWPWGDEVIVAIGGLNTNLGVASIGELFIPDTPVVNAELQSLRVLVQFNEAVEVTGTPTLEAIGTGTTANVTLSYDSGESDPEAGKLVFLNADVDLSAATPDDTLTVNSTSVVAGWNGITDAVSAAVVSNGITAGLSAVFTVTAAE